MRSAEAIAVSWTKGSAEIVLGSVKWDILDLDQAPFITLLLLRAMTD